MHNKKSSTLKRILSLLRDRKKTIVFLFILITLSQIASIAVPFVSKIIIDSLTEFIKNGGTLPLSTLAYCSAGILILTLISSALLSSYNFNLFQMVTKLEDKVRNQTLGKYLQLHSLFHHGVSSGQIIGRIDRGGTSVYIIVYEIIGQNFIPPIIIFIGAFAALLYSNIWIALAIVIPFPIYILATRNIANKIYLIEQKANDAFENISKEMYDVAGNVQTVKKFSQEEKETQDNRNSLLNARKIQYTAERLWSHIENIQAIISTTGRVAVLALSAWFVLQGTATIGQFVLYVTLQNMAYQPLSSLGSLFTRMRRNMTRVERLFAVLDEPLRVTDTPNAFNLPPLQKQIEFKDVSFSYRGDKEWALKDINVIIPAHTTCALVGRSGSGKTTFINLLLRSHDPQRGNILIDGFDISKVTKVSLREQIAVVPQEVDLFSRTVVQNIAYGRGNISKEKIENAAKTALAHDFILKLEQGYDTIVGERGVKLSGGERQRIGIARAVLRDPKILILDEATSHLDTESEQIITRATDALVKDRTSLIIAHRLSTVINADKILVFGGGKIEAMGTHVELLHSSSTYLRLYSLQFADENVEDNNEE
ncbi:MAG: multidrug resistance-like protein ATP-binding protein MdlB [Candidatus Nomurabacteria bacterium GW2011_GWB1_43_7]|uniref:Multidrug resistance-like protein ATP-binding protein MdlB n=1 Tax=Candidatus Nomurabacteria bacterium GW2011_GWB1_43_7 TaxID=1618747 RepID=A0A0G1I8G8_9BACT|nr:MAG: multidrug resistance-like protein ATP-binding protein MdlB [Candidatus Nomurabacteria bacterium GW2011_GWB1_43_7]